MTQLAQMQCEPCKAGGPQMSESEIRDLITELPDWNVDTVDGEQCLSRTVKFKDFAGALAFTQQVGELAEKANHHPVLTTEWGKVTVYWWTHKTGGLHRNDFVMAAKTDRLLE
ncbi:4a-hydroxytetrahydrobiopterin dehydratase [Marinimicrobium sp. ABcell2]|uniref:4a-hydroxytetrahydrobiopterin dehydratase n=1 Tax=Marinimicrobium sp. ABcell2 TaxID=3069751 RepID=UPI0027B22B94|nr:4a-hydroxytetrahydrobiopterin dehydratase [Marinimicrobium sp. ABcell2]MDQ2078446.1 4a-hydroxytetrahydrobiopterin dehydratase [Marinimicrobium sp. ABcell2]